MTVSRKIKILVISLVAAVAVLATAFLVPVSFSAWSGGTTQTSGTTQTGGWGVVVEYITKKDGYSDIFLTRNGEGDSVVYSGAVSGNAGTQIRVLVKGAAVDNVDNIQTSKEVSYADTVFTFVNAGTYRVMYTVATEKLVVNFAVDETMEQIFDSVDDVALKKILSDKGMTGTSGGVRGIVTSSGQVVQIVNDGSLTKFKAVVTLQQGERLALFGHPTVGTGDDSIKIYKFKSNVSDAEKELLPLVNGYFKAPAAGTYEISIDPVWTLLFITDFEISGVKFTPAA